MNEWSGTVSLQETPGTSGDECERKKLTQMEPTKERFDQISQTVFYRFPSRDEGEQMISLQLSVSEWIPRPIVWPYERGTIVRIVEKASNYVYLRCDEDFCMDHGYPILVDGKCSCACEPEYTGEHVSGQWFDPSHPSLLLVWIPSSLLCFSLSQRGYL